MSQECEGHFGGGNNHPENPTNLGEFFDIATKNGAKGTAYFYYGEVDNEEARRIQDATGIDTRGAVRLINEQEIRHAMWGHDERGEHREGQEPITRKDFETIREYVRTADKIGLSGKTDQGLDLIRYQKRVNGHIVVIEEFRRKKQVLAFKTMWKYKTKPTE